MERSNAEGERSRNRPNSGDRARWLRDRTAARVAEKWPYAGASALPHAYLDAVVRAGAQPVVVDPSGDLVPLLDRIDAVVLTGGPDVDPACYGEERIPTVYGVDRAADDAELALVRAALERGVPTLAICRGLQVLNVAFGGTLHQHLPELPGIERHGRPGRIGRRVGAPGRRRRRFPARDGVRHARASPGRATTTRPSPSSATGCASRQPRRTASSKASSSTAPGCWRSSGTPRTPPVATRSSSGSSTRSSTRTLNGVTGRHGSGEARSRDDAGAELVLREPCRSGCGAWRR